MYNLYTEDPHCWSIEPDNQNKFSCLEDIPEKITEALQDLQPYEILDQIPTPTEDAFDSLVSAQVLVPIVGVMQKGIATKLMKDDNGILFGTAIQNIYFDPKTYLVEFPDGTKRELAANIIAQNIYSQLDQEGRQYMVLKNIFTSHGMGTKYQKEQLKGGVSMSSGAMERPIGCQWRNCVSPML